MDGDCLEKGEGPGGKESEGDPKVPEEGGRERGRTSDLTDVNRAL
jgi:hypothetical protein